MFSAAICNFKIQLRWQPQRKKKSLPLSVCGVSWERNSQVDATMSALESQRGI